MVLDEYLIGTLAGEGRGVCERFVFPPVFPTELGYLKDSQPANSGAQENIRREDQNEKKN